MNLRGKIYSQKTKARNACLQGKDQEGFRVRFINEYIGSGVFCEKSFANGDFLLEYRGELISESEGAQRDKNYPESKGSFFYFFEHEGKSKCIDGTASDGRGRMVNDSHKNPNCKMKVIPVQGLPRLCLFAIKDLKKGDELRCDYGVKDLPWRKDEDESNTSLLPHEPSSSSDSESCDAPIVVSNHVSRRKKSQRPAHMERTASHPAKIDIVIKEEPPDETKESFDLNVENGESPLSNGGAATSTLEQTEMVSSEIRTYHPLTDNAVAENGDPNPDMVDLQSFIQSHMDGSEVERCLKSFSISLPFIKLEVNPNLDFADSRQSSEEVCINEAVRSSSDSDSDDETHCTIAMPAMDGTSLLNEDVLPKTEPEDAVSDHLDASDVEDTNGVCQGDLSTEATTESASVPVESSINSDVPSRPHKKKPVRKCPFCLKVREKLPRHIKLMHKDIRRVREAMMLPEKEQQQVFSLMRKEGILISNMQRMKESNNPVLERERRCKDKDTPLVICSSCKGFYAEMFFSRHKCLADREGDRHPIPVTVMASEKVSFNEAPTASSDSHDDDVAHTTIAMPTMDGTSLSNVDAESDDNVSNNDDADDVQDRDGTCQGDPSNEVPSESASPLAESSNSEVQNRPHRKNPARKCPFCLKFRGNLPRHIKLVHKDLRRVREAMMLPEKEQHLAFSLMRKEGILLSNMQKMKESNNPVLEREKTGRKKDVSLVICSLCKGFYDEVFFSRHKCLTEREGDRYPMPVSVMASENPENNDAGSHVHSDDESCGLCCEEEVPPPGSNDLRYQNEHSLLSTDDILLCPDGDMDESSDDSEEECSSISSDDLDFERCTRTGHDDLHVSEGDTSVGSDLNTDEGHIQEGSSDLLATNDNTQASCKELSCDERHVQAFSKGLHSEREHTGASGNDLHSKERHTHVSGDDLHAEEEHTHAGSDGSQTLKASETLTCRNTQEENYTDDPEANSSHNLSETCGESDRVTQDIFQSDRLPLETSQKKILKNSGMSSKKSHQKCPFCLRFVKGHLRKHIACAHINMRQVKDALKLPEKERKVAFDLMKKAGTLLANKEKMNPSDRVLDREHRARTGHSLVMCGGCHRIFRYKTFWRHKIKCQSDILLEDSSELERGSFLEFKNDVLAYLPDDEISDLCRSDPTLLLLGKRWWKENTKLGYVSRYIRKNVITDVRKLATLFKHFEEQQKTHGCGMLGQLTVRDMFDEQNFQPLCEAANIYSRNVESSKVKAKLMSSLFILLKKACKVIKASHVAEGSYIGCVEMDAFMAVLVQHRDSFLSGGENQVMQGSCSDPTDAAYLSMEEDVRKLRNHISDEVSSILSDTSTGWNANSFKKLRDVTVLRLTILNARQACEPCCLTMKECQDRGGMSSTENQVGCTADVVENGTVENWTRVYQAGLRSSSLVPVSIPSDCMKAMEILSSRDNRELVGVAASNPYIFPCMEGLEHLASGWDVLNDICDEAGINKDAKLRTAENYGWISLVYASMELSEPDENVVSRKMEHTSDGNDTAVIQEDEEVTMGPTEVGKGQKRKLSCEDQEEETMKTKKVSSETSESHSMNCNHHPRQHHPLKDSTGSQFSRHSIGVHKNLDNVRYTANEPECTRKRYFERMKKLGQMNIQQGLQGSKSLRALRVLRSVSTSPAVTCKFSKGTNHKMNLRKHQCRRYLESLEDNTIPQSFAKVQEEDPYFANSVLATIMHSSIGKACMKDNNVVMVGRWIWNVKKGRTQGAINGNSEVLKAMRNLVLLKAQFQEEMLSRGKKGGSSIVDMFCCENIDVLMTAVSSVAAKTGENAEDDVEKELFLLIKKAAAILLATILIGEEDEKVSQIKNFVAVFDKRDNTNVSEAMESQVHGNKEMEHESTEEPLLGKNAAKTGSRSLGKRKECWNKEVDHISHLLESYFRTPHKNGNKDLFTTKEADNNCQSDRTAQPKRLSSRRKSKGCNQNWASLADSDGEDEETGQDNYDNEFSLRDSKSREGTGKKHKWSKQATDLILEHFKPYICTAGEINRGKLPGKKEMKDFLKKNREVLREVKTVDRKVLLIKAKVFNERNSYRRKLQQANDGNVDTTD